jgi:hypothetical protein
MLMLISAMLAAQAEAPPPPVRFVPVAVRVSFRMVPGGAISDCSVALTGDPDPHWHDDPCRNIGSASFLDALGIESAAAGPMTLVLTLEANGRAVDPGAVPGRATFRSEARFALTAAGAVSRCDAAAPIGRAAIDLCRTGFPLRPQPFVPASASEGVRGGTLSLTLFR